MNFFSCFLHYFYKIKNKMSKIVKNRLGRSERMILFHIKSCSRHWVRYIISRVSAFHSFYPYRIHLWRFLEKVFDVVSAVGMNVLKLSLNLIIFSLFFYFFLSSQYCVWCQTKVSSIFITPLQRKKKKNFSSSINR